MNEHKNIITIEDEIKEFSDKPVKSSALFKALEEKGVPDSSEASVGDVLSLDEDKSLHGRLRVGVEVLLARRFFPGLLRTHRRRLR